jgi:hypothetical protein
MLRVPTNDAIDLRSFGPYFRRASTNNLCSEGVQYLEVPGMFDLEERTFFGGADDDVRIFLKTFLVGSSVPSLSVVVPGRSRFGTTVRA